MMRNNERITVTILFMKSLLTSLFQREVSYPSWAKRGKGRFSDLCKFNLETLNKKQEIYGQRRGIINEREVENARYGVQRM